MKRVQLTELHEQEWFPRTLRDLFTDTLSFLEASKELYAPVADLLAPIIRRYERFMIVDLCSGAGLPIITVVSSLSNDVANRVRVLLTDKYPNISAFDRLSKTSGERIGYIDNSVDATDVPDDLQGFRTFFSSFHHFDEKLALAILSDAVDKRQGIGIFEFTERRLLLRLAYHGIPLQIWLLRNTPSISPFRWKRIFWTYLIPVIPLVFCWDGFVSCLRSYSQTELHGLIKDLGDCGYSWDVGRIESTAPFHITYCIGFPFDKASTAAMRTSSS